jgi:hypothetical protein
VQEDPEVAAFQRRFEFLYPARTAGAPRYRLCWPDVLELRWSVWDNHEKHTVAYGVTPAQAVDAAIEKARPAPLST